MGRGSAVVANVGGFQAVRTTWRSGKRGDHAVCVDLADAVIVRIRDVYVAMAVHRDIGRGIEVGIEGGAPVAGEPLGSITGESADVVFLVSRGKNGGDRSFRFENADALIVRVGDIDVRRRVDDDPAARKR